MNLSDKNIAKETYGVKKKKIKCYQQNRILRRLNPSF